MKVITYTKSLVNKGFSSTRRTSVSLGILKLLKAVLSLFTISLSAKFFGVSTERDAWIIGGVIVTFFSSFLFGPIINVFRTKFIFLKEEKGEKKAIESCNSLVTGIIIICLVIIFLGELFPLMHQRFFAPGFDSQESAVLKVMVRWLLPSLLINQLITIYSSILNSYGSFMIPDFFGLFTAVLNVLFLVFLAPVIGIYSLIISSYLSTILLFFVLWKSLNRLDVKFNFFHFKYKEFYTYILFALPLYINYFAGQFLSVFERQLCTMMDSGTVSAFDYAKRFGDLSIGVILSVVPIVLTPILSSYFVKKDSESYHKEYFMYLKMFLIGIIPVVILFTIGSRDIVDILFNHGNFQTKFSNITVDSLFWIGVGVAGVILYVIAGESLVAQGKIKIISIVSGVGYAIMVGLDYLLYKEFGASIFTFTWAIVHILMGISLFTFGIDKKYFLIHSKDFLKVFIFYIVCIIFSLALNLLLLKSSINVLGRLSLQIILSFAVIFSLIFLLKMDERNIILQFIKKKKNA